MAESACSLPFHRSCALASVHDFGLYKIDPDYLEYLHHIDSEVYYSPAYRLSTKPFVGIITPINDTNYFIPLTSPKLKHRRWKNVSLEHFIVYEIIDNEAMVQGDYYKHYSENQSLHLLSILDIKKMIPAPINSYTPIEFQEISDYKYKNLLEKEYRFCLSIKNKILRNASRLYCAQRSTNKIHYANCNFAKLEHAMRLWLYEHQKITSFDEEMKRVEDAYNNLIITDNSISSSTRHRMI